jgi:FeS assembly SUF system regulator
MLKLNKLADYATVLLTSMASAPAEVCNGQALSQRTHIPAPTVAKVLKALTRGGLVRSSRGLHGGYQLARPAHRITVAEIVQALEGPIAITDCAVHGTGCEIADGCRSRKAFRLIDSAIREALAAVTLADILGAEHDQPLRFHPSTRVTAPTPFPTLTRNTP